MLQEKTKEKKRTTMTKKKNEKLAITSSSPLFFSERGWHLLSRLGRGARSRFHSISLHRPPSTLPTPSLMDRASTHGTTTASSSSSGPKSSSNIRAAELAAAIVASSVATAGLMVCGAMAAPTVRRYRSQMAAIEEVREEEGTLR